MMGKSSGQWAYLSGKALLFILNSFSYSLGKNLLAPKLVWPLSIVYEKLKL